MYFAYHIVSGERSYSRLAQLENLASAQELAIESLEFERSELERKVTMMRPDTLSADMVEEQARYILGFNLADEYVVIDNNLSQ